jgi:hypothetical protein
MQGGKAFIEQHLSTPGVYVLYRNDEPYYIGKTGKTLFKRLKQHALKPNTRYYNFWNYFSAFQIDEESERDKIEAILISAMPTANNSHPRTFHRKKLDRDAAKMLNRLQARMLTGIDDQSGEPYPESEDEEI